ncbi:MAG: hypothetical protein ACRCVZ_11530 [Aestuariivirga sp.]|jgi:hypothetical protein
MTKIFKSLLPRKKKGPSPEEVEALDRATKVLQWRVEQITRVQPAETAQKRVA